MKILYNITGDHVLVFQLSSYLDRLKRVDGRLETSGRVGICQGSLSPIFSSIYLSYLDQHMIKKGESFYYARYQDDIIIMTKSKSALRRVKLEMYKILERLQLMLRPEKTQVGTIGTKYISFLGYDIKFEKNGEKYLTLSQKTLDRHNQKINSIIRRRYAKRFLSQQVAVKADDYTLEHKRKQKQGQREHRW